jgi:hypothetical protein
VRALGWAALLLAALGAAEAAAHSRSQSYSTWSAREGRIVATWSILAREVTRLPGTARGTPLEVVLAEHLDRSVRVTRAGAPCAATAPARPLTARPGHLRAELRFECDRAGELAIESDAFFEQAPSHVHFARMSGAGGAVEHLFTDALRQRVLLDAAGAEPEPRGASFAGYLRLGFEHILVGYDHIAFLVALLLLGGRLRDVLFVVTGFTLGHSLTLSLAVLGWVRVDTVLVEALIGFSIALVAAENLSLRAGWNTRLAGASAAALAVLALLSGWAGIGPPWLTLAGLALFVLCYLRFAASPDAARRIRPTLTMLFGLVHGFGFATMLTEIGIPPDRLLAGLLGFNVGVELGQIVIVLLLCGLAWAGRRMLARLDPWQFADVVSAGLCAVGLYWFLERAYG